jgi:hypothetical protein
MRKYNKVMKSNLNRRLRYRKQNIKLRRDRVEELDAQLYNQRDIAAKLNVSIGLVNSDLKIIRAKARENIKDLVDKRLFEEYNRTLRGLDSLLNESVRIKENATDNHERMQAISLAKECYKARLEMLTNPDVIEDIAKFVNKRTAAIGSTDTDTDIATDNTQDIESSDTGTNIEQETRSESINK